MTMQQLTLSVQLRDDATFNNFYEGNNQHALASLQNATALQEKFIYLSGPLNSGRTHLLHACCHEAGKHGLTTVYLPLADYQLLTPDIFENLEISQLVCVDDLDAIAGKREWEEGLFHLYNRLLTTDHSLIVAASAAATQLPLVLPDLKSRLSHGLTFQLHSLDDKEKITVLSERAKQRGMHLSSDVAQFLLSRCSRDMGTLFDILDRLDHASLAEQRKLTIPFIKMVLKI